MIPYGVRYHRASSLSEAASRLSQSRDAKILAGGQTLIAAMKMRLAQPTELIDISGIEDLAGIRADAGSLRVGAAARHFEVATSKAVRDAIPALSHLAGLIGDPAVRHMGTLGGSLANNDPAADYPAAVLALGATIVTSKRRIPADDFFTGMFATALADDEIVTEVVFPVPISAGYAKFPNPASHYAMVGAFVARFQDGVRVAITGAGSCVFRKSDFEAALTRDFSARALDGIVVDHRDLNSDIHGSAEYRAELIGVMTRRAVAAAS